MSDDLPIPEPKGALVPPRRNPPTAVGLSTPPPPPPLPSQGSRGSVFARIVTSCLDILDYLADDIARALRLR